MKTPQVFSCTCVAVYLLPALQIVHYSVALETNCKEMHAHASWTKTIVLGKLITVAMYSYDKYMTSIPLSKFNLDLSNMDGMDGMFLKSPT